MLNVNGRSGNRVTVAGLIASAAPVNFTVTFAVAEAFSESRTVISMGVSAETPLGVTENVDPDTVVVTGSMPLFVEKTV